MKTIKFLIAAITIFILIPFTGISKDDEGRLDSLFTLLEDKDKLMASISVIHEGEVIYERAIGMRWMDDSGKIPSGVDTRYRIGSITKTYTSVMILQLVDEGVITLDHKLADFFPEFPNAKHITIEHMLRHQSGLYNFTSAPEYMTYATKPRSRDSMLYTMNSFDAEFFPGEATQYSNTNYVLLGYIIEELTGSSYAEALQERIAEPLELELTQFAKPVDPENNIAHSFFSTGDGWEIATESNLEIAHGAGAIVSTATEVNRFMEAIFAGNLISEELQNKMLTLDDNFGMGILLVPFHEKTGYGHTGGIDGFMSLTSWFPEEDLGLTILSNGYDYSINEIAIGILSILLDYPYDMPEFSEPVVLSKEELNPFVGEYTSDALPMDITIAIDGDKLTAQATNQPSFHLRPIGNQSFEYPAAGLKIVFDQLENNHYQRLILNQGGGRYIFERIQE